MKCEIKKISEMDIYAVNSKYYKYYTAVNDLAEDECIVFKFESEDELNKFNRQQFQKRVNIILKKQSDNKYILKTKKMADEYGFILIKQKNYNSQHKKRREHWGRKKDGRE